MTRCIGIDLHTDSFTACILQEGESERMQTLRLQNGGLESFLATLLADDELAVLASSLQPHPSAQRIGAPLACGMCAPWIICFALRFKWLIQDGEKEQPAWQYG